MFLDYQGATQTQAFENGFCAEMGRLAAQKAFERAEFEEQQRMSAYYRQTGIYQADPTNNKILNVITGEYV